MRRLKLSRAFTLIEPGPVVLVTTHDGTRPNIMTITWTMVMDFSPRFAITTGPWNHSYAALVETGECVLSIPSADMIDTAIGIGTCTGAETDKFDRFGLTPRKGKHVRAPLIAECMANIECRLADVIDTHSILVLDGLAAWVDEDRKDSRMLHYHGDGTFTADGRRFDRAKAMAAKLPPGL